jgi:serine/threonine-protein kinase
LGVFVVCFGVLSAILRAHHTPAAADALRFLFGVSGWALVWGGFTWLMYIGLEPYVRRVWPNTLVSWTRLMSGRWRDPLIGRDVLVGLLAGVIRTALVIGRLRLAHRAPPDILFTPALESLGSVRHFMNMAFARQVLESLEYALGALFLMFVIRVIVRKTWIAAGIAALLVVPLGFRGGDPLSGWELIWVVGSGLFGTTILLRVGLLACLVMLFFTGSLTVGAVTLDPGAWYFGTSAVTLLVVTALAVYGFLVSLGDRPALSVKAA